MNYANAIKTAKHWTEGIDPRDEGWRGIMLLLLQRILALENTNANLHDLVNKQSLEIAKLSLDLGIKQEHFKLPYIPPRLDQTDE